MGWLDDVKLDLRDIARKRSDLKAIASGNPKKIAKRFLITKPAGRLFGKAMSKLIK